MKNLIKSFLTCFCILYICFTIGVGDWNIFNYSEDTRMFFAVVLLFASLIGCVFLYIEGEDD
jgi:hypothetical protein